MENLTFLDFVRVNKFSVKKVRYQIFVFKNFSVKKVRYKY